MFSSDELIIIKTDFGGVLEQSGAPPEGMRTVWIPADDAQNFYWRNNKINGKTIGYFPIGAELDRASKQGFKVYVISVPDQFLFEESTKLGCDWSLAEKPGYPDHFVIDEYTLMAFETFA